MYLGVIVNPFARKNRGMPDNRSAALRRIVGPWGEVHETGSVDELRGIVARLCPRASHVVSDGGDGALHWLINEILAQEIGSATVAGIRTHQRRIHRLRRPQGASARTGRCDSARSHRGRAGRSTTSARCGSTLWSYAVKPRSGTTFHRIGFALAAGGVGNRFFDEYDAQSDPGRLTIARVIGRAVADYAASRLSTRRPAGHLFTPTRARVVIDGQEVPTRTHNALHAGAFDVNLGGVLRVFPLARAAGVVHFQAGAIPPAHMIANLPGLVAGRAIRSAGMRDVSGREMVIEAEHQPLSPIIDGERFTDITRLIVRPGPQICIAVPGSLNRQ